MNLQKNQHVNRFSNRQLPAAVRQRIQGDNNLRQETDRFLQDLALVLALTRKVKEEILSQ